MVENTNMIIVSNILNRYKTDEQIQLPSWNLVKQTS
jgi:hypothetical protein